jgi:hypothetical protein
MNETVADVVDTSYNDHEIHTRFLWSPGGRGMQVRSSVFVSILGKNHTQEFMVTPDFLKEVVKAVDVLLSSQCSIVKSMVK